MLSERAHINVRRKNAVRYASVILSTLIVLVFSIFSYSVIFNANSVEGEEVQTLNLYPSTIKSDHFVNTDKLFFQDVNEYAVFGDFSKANSSSLSAKPTLSAPPIDESKLIIIEEENTEPTVDLVETISTSSMLGSDELNAISTTTPAALESVDEEESEVSTTTNNTNEPIDEPVDEAIGEQTNLQEEATIEAADSIAEEIPIVLIEEALEAQITSTTTPEVNQDSVEESTSTPSTVSSLWNVIKNMFSNYVVAQIEEATTTEQEVTEEIIEEEIQPEELPVFLPIEIPQSTTTDQLEEVSTSTISSGVDSALLDSPPIPKVEILEELDEEPPVIAVTGNNPAYIEVGASYNDLGALITSVRDQFIGIKYEVDGEVVESVQIDTSYEGVHSIVYSATDIAGNVGYAERKVVVGNVTEDVVIKTVFSEETNLSEDSICDEGNSGCITKTIEFADFDVAPVFQDQNIKNAQLRFSLAGKPHINSFSNSEGVVVEYFYKGKWRSSGAVMFQEEVSNATNGGYFLYALPIFTNWDELDGFKVRLKYQSASGFVGDVYLESLWVEIETGVQEKKEKKVRVYKRDLNLPALHDLLSEQDEFKGDDEISLRLKYKKQRNIVTRILRNIFSEKQYEISKITLVHPTVGETEPEFKVDYNKDGTYSLKILNKTQAMRPGKYTMKMTVEEGSESFVDEMEFYWGVLAMNSNKSVYEFGETAKIDMAALTDSGNTICDADLLLEITSPGGNTEESAVTLSGDCFGNNVTDVPDYSSLYTPSEFGFHTMNLKRLNALGEVVHEISDQFDVVEARKLYFDIERIGPTRIFPVAPYEMIIRVTPLNNYKGTFVERIPKGFVLSNFAGAGESVYEDYKTLTWELDLQAGETKELTYIFDAPDISPYLFLMGPAKIDRFTEARAWQIASDAVSGIAWLTGTEKTSGTNLNNSAASFKWSTSTFDTVYFGHSTSTNPERLTVKQDGDYLFAVTMPFQHTDTPDDDIRIELNVRVNGVNQDVGIGRGYSRARNTINEGSAHLSVLLNDLSQDDYVEIRVGGTADTLTTATTTQGSLYAEFIGSGETIFSATATRATTSTNLNQAVASELIWHSDRVDTGYTHTNGSSTDVTLTSADEYLVFVNVPLEAADKNFNITGKILLDGVEVSGGRFQQGYISGENNDFESSIHWSGIVQSTTSSQVLSVSVEQEAQSGTVDVGTDLASLYIQKLPASEVYVGLGNTLTTASNEWNPASPQSVEFTTDVVIDTSAYTHSTTSNSHQITVDTAGNYFLTYNDAITVAAQDVNIIASVKINGATTTGAETKSHFIRDGNGHDRSSGSLVFLLPDLSANDIVTIEIAREGEADATNDDADAIIMLWKKSSFNAPPEPPTLHGIPFDSERHASTTPPFEFTGSDPDGSQDIRYEISWSTTTTFISSTTKVSGTDSGFVNLDTPADTDPFTEGERIRFNVQSADTLVSGTTYFWRVRALDVSGSDIYGEWTTTRSFTVQDGVDPSDWFQTKGAQFNNDTFDETEISGDSVRLSTATNTEALVAYGEGTVQTPRSRIWNGTSWSSESSAQDVGGVINFVVTKGAPTRDEYILGTQDTSGDVNVQIYNGVSDTWGNLDEVHDSLSRLEQRGFYLTYESVSGDAMAVSCYGTDAVYQIWNGTSWTATSSISIASAKSCEWLKLTSNPTSDEIILLTRDDGSQYDAQIWNGSSWGNAIALGSHDTRANEGLALEYEESGDQAIVIVANGGNNSFLWNSWNGTSWGTEAAEGIEKKHEWGYLSRDEGTDNMAFCYIDNDADIGVVRWDGDAWLGQTELSIIGNSRDGRAVDCAFETVGSRDGYIMVSYSDTVDGNYQYFDGSSWSGENDLADLEDSFVVQSRRTEDGNILNVFFDDVNDRYDFTYWDGTSWSDREALDDNPSANNNPFLESLMIAPKVFRPASGKVKSIPVDFSLVPNQPTWGDVSFSSTEPAGSDIKLKVYYTNTATCDTLVPDGALSGNSSGFDVTDAPVDISGISTTTYSEICIEAELTSTGVTPTLDDWRVTWVRKPVFIQNYYRWYTNLDGLTPTDPWPLGGTNLSENTLITVNDSAPYPSNVLRLRMSVNVTNVDMSTTTESFKLQYSEITSSCTSPTNSWFDVAPISSTTAKWRGYNNASISDGSELSSTLLSTSDVYESYEEENNTASNPNIAYVDDDAEWDFAIEHNQATAGADYCFRMVTDGGIVFEDYINYPQLRTNAAPNAPVLSKLFDNEQVASTTPWFEFSSDDVDTDDMTYEIQVDTDSLFGSPDITANSQDDATAFSNIITPADKDPFTSGQMIRFKATTTLSNNTTYWWKVRARDKNASNEWSEWSTARSFTVDTSTSITTWYQTTEEQFDTNSNLDTEATSTDDVVLTPPLTAGTTTSSSIDFDWKTSGNAWGSFDFNDSEGNGNIIYRIEYFASTSDWIYIPDSDLSGNIAGFDSGPVSLLALDPDVYDQIRIEATFTVGTPAPSLNDWTIEWGLAVEKPILNSPFDNEKFSTTSPSFIFYSTDPQDDDLVYEISWSTSTSFIASTTKISSADIGFENLASTTDTSPFVAGDAIQYSIQPADVLNGTTTYWWRVRGIDPGGGNVWSVWSDMQSFTTATSGESIIISTWYQNTQEQFETDSLVGLETTASNTVEISAIIREALVAYGEGAVQAPRYRKWDGSSWSDESTADSVGSPINWVVTRAAPTRDEYALGTIGTDGDVNVQIFDNASSTWGNLSEITNNVNALYRGFDIAYETDSGDALVVACDATNAVYRTWNGTSWSATTSITFASTNNCEWIKLASHPTSDEIVLLTKDDGNSGYEAQVWSGSSWGNSVTLGSSVDGKYEGMDVVYEESGGQAIIVVGDNAASQFAWNSWNGSSWSGNSTQALEQKVAWMSIVRDVGSDNLVMCYIDRDTDIGIVRWSGSGWSTFQEIEIEGNSRDGRPVDCVFETSTGREGNILITYSDDTNARYDVWNGTSFNGEASISTITDSWVAQSRRAEDGTILSVFFDDVNDRYDFSSWNGSSWTSVETLDSNPSVTGEPFHESLMIAPRIYPTVTYGFIDSTDIYFYDGAGPKWGEVYWEDTKPGTSQILYQVYYEQSSSTYALVPDSAIPDNSIGTSTSPIDLKTIDFRDYYNLRLRANLYCVDGDCPILNNWTLTWDEGLEIFGTIYQYDQVSTTTSGTVAVAINGLIQPGKTGAIQSDGTWQIDNVTIFEGDVVTVFVDGAADENEAVGVTVFDGFGDVNGFELYERHLSLGTDDLAVITNTDLSQYDFSVSGDEDIFFDVDGANDLFATSTGTFDDVELFIRSGNAYKPATAGSADVYTHDVEINGEFIQDSNDIYIQGSWDNNAGYDSGSGLIIFTATSTTETIDSTGAATSSFNNATFGQSSGSATWELASLLDINGDAGIDYGTLFASTSQIAFAGDVTVSSNGLFRKGTATTTFDGTGTSVWTDNTSIKQDFGIISIDGSAKTIEFGSNVAATNVTIGSNDTLSSSGSSYDIIVYGNWVNNNVFTAQNGEVIFAGTTTSYTITPGSSDFYDLRFLGQDGIWAFTSTDVTVDNNLTFASGTVTLASGTTTVTGSLQTTGGVFVHNNGSVLFNGTGPETITASTSPFYDLYFNGVAGSWAMNDGSATSSNDVHIINGTPTLPSGTLAIGNDFVNSDLFNANGGTMRFYSSNTDREVNPGNSNFANIIFDGTGGWVLPSSQNINVDGDITLEDGIATSTSKNLYVGGSWINNGGDFVPFDGTVVFNSSDTGEIVDAGASSFATTTFDSPTGGWTISADATSTSNWNVSNADTFIVSPGFTVEVQGEFNNAVGGASTTWSGSTLYLNSGTDYGINLKTSGEDAYGAFVIGVNTDIDMWNSTSTTYVVDGSGSLYSQDHNKIDGELRIWGDYVRTSGNDYWSYATDFDGTDITGSERQANVLFYDNATTTYLGGTLEIVGSSTASTSINNQGFGDYNVIIGNAAIDAQYYAFRNLGPNGLVLTDTPTITSLQDGDFELAVDGGSTITVGGSAIDANPALQVERVRFATTTLITGFNVTATGTPSSYWWFRYSYDNLFGELFDSDPAGNPGNIRWDNSNVSITVAGNVYSDEGQTAIGNPPCDGATNVVKVVVNGGSSFSGSCDAGTGAYSIAGVSFTGDPILTVYLDTNGGKRAATITRTPTADISDMDLYENYVIVRHEDTTPLSIADMSIYDNNDDSDIPFVAEDAVPDTLDVEPNTGVFIWHGKTFIPGGDITLDSGGLGGFFDGTLKAGTSTTLTFQNGESHSFGGSFVMDTTTIFDAADVVMLFDATTTGKVVAATSTLEGLLFNGAGGEWDIASSTTLTNDLTITSGTVVGAGDVLVSGGDVTGAGVLNKSGGTVTLLGDGSFGGNENWTLYNLALGDGVTAATTTKTGTGSTTISGVFTIDTNHAFLGATSDIIFNGNGTPFVINGAFEPDSTLVSYTGTGATNITTTNYQRLLLAASGGSPTYTIQSGNLIVNDSLTFGDGINTVSINADSNDPTIDVGGTTTIKQNATFIASSLNPYTTGASFINDGTFTHSSGLVIFNASTTGHVIETNTSPFFNVNFDSSSGGWTISENATATNNLNLNNIASFAVSPSVTLEVDGQFYNGVASSTTTWTDSTLYLNSGTVYTVNVNNYGDDSYGNLLIGNNTHSRMWNSTSTTVSTIGSGSHYSQDHNLVDGDLYIWGDYPKSSGNDYWSYATDFDGTDLSGGGERKVDVYLADNATATVSGGALTITGDASFKTSILSQGSGTYSFIIDSGTFSASNYDIRDIDISGLKFTGTPTVTEISNGNFLLEIDGGSMITVAGSVIDNNSGKTFTGNVFATSTGVSSGANVEATGTSVGSWRFTSYTGNYGGESYDTDPGGDPGYIIWDDSDSQITISGNVYSDEGATAIGNPPCDGSTYVVQLRVAGVGTASSTCDSVTGAYSISGVSFSPGDEVAVYLDTNGGARAANISVDPVTNISNMHLYENRVIVRHEDSDPITNTDLAVCDNSSCDTDIPFDVSGGDLVLEAGTELHIWDSKTYAPGGDITLHANAGAEPDGTLHIGVNASFVAAAGESHSVGGSLDMLSGATLNASNSTFTFSASTTGKIISATSSPFYNLVFNGSGGAWSFPPGVVESVNDFTITAGTVTLASGTTTVAGSFNNTSGTFAHNNGLLYMIATSSGKTVEAGGSDFYNMTFNGSDGEWTIQDVNATTSNNINITVGSTTLPTGTFAIGGSFLNDGGTFIAPIGSNQYFTSTGVENIYANDSDFGSMTFDGTGGVWTFIDEFATSTGDFVIDDGSVLLATGTLAVAESFDNSGGSFTATTSSIVRLFGAGGSETISAGGSLFRNLIIDGIGGTWTLSGDATTTEDLSLLSATGFTASGFVEVQGEFTNLVGGGATSWTGSELFLRSGTNYSVNNKSAGGDSYDTLIVGTLASSTDLRLWNSTSTIYTLQGTSSIYSQDHNSINGDLYIWGDYLKESGADYWNYATDFDGADISGSPRSVDVYIADSATTTYSGGTLNLIGTAGATSTIQNQGAGSYGLRIIEGTINASYFAMRNMDASGLYLSGTSTTVTSLSNGDFELSVNGGNMITVSSSTIDINPTLEITNTRFATSSGISSGFNIARDATSTNSWNFTGHFGNYDGESYDDDGYDLCGSFVWDDSTCLQVTQEHFRVRNDDGGIGVPDSEWFDTSFSKRKRIRISDTSGTSTTNLQVKVTVDYDSDMQSDFDDLRFTDESGTTSIDYFTESFIASASSTVWVEVPSILASSYADIFVYYGSTTAVSAASGTATFLTFDDFEDNNISEYSGDTTSPDNFDTLAAFNYEGTYGLGAEAGEELSQTTDGIYRTGGGSSFAQDNTVRYFHYIDMSSGGDDETCTLFGVQTPGSDNNNYALCLDPYNTDQIIISKDVSSNDGSGSALATKNVTFTTGWYEVEIDWQYGGTIDVSLYRDGAIFATTTATDSTYSSGGFGFSFWGQHGGWDLLTAREYLSSLPSYSTGLEQGRGGASWKSAEDTPVTDQIAEENVRVRFTIANSGPPIVDQNYRLIAAPKTGYAQCESVPSEKYMTVPLDSSCDSAKFACMSTSSSVTNLAATTQLLSIPSSSTFTNGQFVENPSNQTGDIDISQNYFTELEYSIKFTSNASSSAYCLKVNNAGLELDSYSKVADIGLLQTPILTSFTLNSAQDIALTPGATTTVYATGTVIDFNGFADLDYATTTIYRSAVGPGCTQDENNCYEVETAECTFTNCFGNSCDLQCYADMQYFSDPTDSGVYVAQEWLAEMSVFDFSGAKDTETTLGVDVLTLRALTASSSIPYGTLSVNSDTGDYNATTTVTNEGNDNIDVSLSGTDLTFGPSTISVNNQQYSTSTFTYSACGLCGTLTGTPSQLEVDLFKPTSSTTPIKDDIYWGLFVPTGVAGATHEGINTFTAVGD